MVTARVSAAGVDGQMARETEIEDLHAAARRHHHVAGLHVAVHESGLVRRRQRVGDLLRVVDDAIDRQAALGNPGGERPALDVLHDEELGVVTPTELVDGDDVRMVQA